MRIPIAISMFESACARTLLPSMSLIAITLLPIAAQGECRDAYSHTNGLREAPASVGGGYYKATVKGTIIDTKADKHRAALYFDYKQRGTDPDNHVISTAEHTSAQLTGFTRLITATRKFVHTNKTNTNST